MNLETSFSEPKPVLLNEGENPIIQEIGEHNPTGCNIQVDTLPLKGEEGQPGSLDLLLKGKYAGIVTGINSTTAEVIRKAIDVIGTKDGLVSSFFSMEADGQEPLYLGDCAVVPAPDAETLFKIARQTYESVHDLGVDKLRIAFLRSEGEPDAQRGDVVSDVVTRFSAEYPDADNLGAVTWQQARNQGANTLIFPGLNSGNIVYKVVHDPDGGDWQAMDIGGTAAKVLQKGERKLYLSNNERTHIPSSEELVDMTIQAFEVAKQQSDSQESPVVAMLSFATENSSTAEDVQRVKVAYDTIRATRPDIPIIGPVQWDSAREESVYRLKTKKPDLPEGKGYPGGKQPDVLIFPDRDSASFTYDALQEVKGGGRVAVGPVLQGFRDGIKIVDLSRGANRQDVIGAIQIVGRLGRAATPKKDGADAATSHA
jgi:phosphotransacetylase